MCSLRCQLRHGVVFRHCSYVSRTFAVHTAGRQGEQKRIATEDEERWVGTREFYGRIMVVSNDGSGARQLGRGTCTLRDALPWLNPKARLGSRLGRRSIFECRR